MEKFDETAELPSHTPGTSKGEERLRRHGREDTKKGRVARDSTSVNPEAHGPIDPRMPHLPPA
jgi:hypothetical protein